jgi:hypothetical protein
VKTFLKMLLKFGNLKWPRKFKCVRTRWVRGATPFSVKTLSIMTFSIIINNSRHLTKWHSVQSVAMLSVTKSLSSAVMLNVVTLNVVAPGPKLKSLKFKNV